MTDEHCPQYFEGNCFILSVGKSELPRGYTLIKCSEKNSKDCSVFLKEFDRDNSMQKLGEELFRRQWPQED